MKCKQELEYLAMVAQDFINKQDRSAQIALAEKSQTCVSKIEQALIRLQEIEQKTASMQKKDPETEVTE